MSRLSMAQMALGSHAEESRGLFADAITADWLEGVIWHALGDDADPDDVRAIGDHLQLALNERGLIDERLENAAGGGDDRHGGTALILASRLGLDIVVRALLSRDANIEATDDKGETALHHASARGHLDTVRILLDNGAVVDKVVTATDGDEGLSAGMTALMLASDSGRVNVVRLLLQKGHAAIDAASEHGVTSLMHAVISALEYENAFFTWMRHKATVQTLLELGANVNMTDLPGPENDAGNQTALQYAMERWNEAISNPDPNWPSQAEHAGCVRFART